MTTPTMDQIHVELLRIRDKVPVFYRIDDTSVPESREAVLFLPSMPTKPGGVVAWAPGEGFTTWDKLRIPRRAVWGTVEVQMCIDLLNAFKKSYPDHEYLVVPGLGKYA